MKRMLHLNPYILDWVDIRRVGRMVVQDNTVVFKEGN